MRKTFFGCQKIFSIKMRKMTSIAYRRRPFSPTTFIVVVVTIVTIILSYPIFLLICQLSSAGYGSGFRERSNFHRRIWANICYCHSKNTYFKLTLPLSDASLYSSQFPLLFAIRKIRDEDCL